MSPERFHALVGLFNGCAGEPWSRGVVPSDVGMARTVVASNGAVVAVVGTAGSPWVEGNAAFIAAAPEAVRELLGEVERLRVALATAQRRAEVAEATAQAMIRSAGRVH